MAKTLDELYDEIKSLNKDEAIAYATERCEAEGGEWCLVLDDLGGGKRSLDGVNNLGAVTVTAKAKAAVKKHKKTIGAVVILVVLIAVVAWWYFKIYKKQA